MIFVRLSHRGKDENGEYVLSVLYLNTTRSSGCAGTKDSYVIFLFEDGTSLELKNDRADIDCGNTATSIYILTDDEVEKLSIKVSAANKILEYQVLLENIKSKKTKNP